MAENPFKSPEAEGTTPAKYRSKESFFSILLTSIIAGVAVTAITLLFIDPSPTLKEGLITLTLVTAFAASIKMVIHCLLR